MEPHKVDMFVMTNSKFFDSHQIPLIRERLVQSDDTKWIPLQSMQFKDPTISLIVSLLGGAFGIDRFLIGDVGLGIAKLLTCGGLGVWTIVDWFLIMGTTRDKNLDKIHEVLY